MTPSSQGVMSCPCCHHTIGGTATTCPNCHAEKHFGPVSREIILSSLIGFLLAPSVAFLLIPLSFWFVLIAAGGLFLGFAFAQYRFNTDRWICSKQSPHIKETD